MVDVIVPVYNTPIADLERCLNSIVCQHYDQWKVILVDDGSEKELAEWLDKHYGKDSRFQIIHSQNGGVSSARNIGLSYSEGEYVAFCDADDTLEPEFLVHAAALMEQYGLDLAVGGCQQKMEASVKDWCCPEPEKELWIYEGDQIYDVIDYMMTGLRRYKYTELGTVYLGSLWVKMYRRSVLKGIWFDRSVHMSEDMLYNIEYMLRCGRVGVTSEIWYSYYCNSYSATNKPRTFIAQQQFEFSKALNRLRPQCPAPQLENTFNICLFWKMEYCLRTAYLQKKHCIKAMRDILQQEPFMEAMKLRTDSYIGLKMRTKLIVYLVKGPKKLRAWGLYVYYSAFYTASKLSRLLRRVKYMR